ncbi:degenerin-like protein unc-105 [Galendromus occidentalis]|uniref:Degenerin-like protein unc-105 n=1 Tax=Galendromus occidentalis TaxID=34638 RepID=A0AAJ7SFF6_9ACAR|nr:degenerin-like protein unc-105 [Galendromus occidentalis]
MAGARSFGAIFFCVICVLIVYLQVSELYIQYGERRTRVSQQEIPDQDLEFPSITTCVDFWTNRTRLCEILPKNCSKKALTIVMYAFFQQSLQPALRNQSAFRPAELFECKLYSSDPTCSEIIDCAPHIQLSSFRRPIQMCYTLDLHRSGLSLKCGHLSTYGVDLLVSANPREALVLVRTERIPLIVLESGISPMTENIQIDLRRGFSHEIAMKQQVVKSLKAPYESNCRDYHAMGYQHIFNGYHSMESCLQDCFVRAELQACGCVSFGHEFIANMRHEICADIERGIEYCRDLVSNSSASANCFELCRKACREVRYDLRLARMSGMKDVDPAHRETSFQVVLRFATNSVEHLEYHPAISFEKVIAYLGGSLGACIGITIVQLLNGLVAGALAISHWLKRRFLTAA